MTNDPAISSNGGPGNLIAPCSKFSDDLDIVVCEVPWRGQVGTGKSHTIKSLMSEYRCEDKFLELLSRAGG